MHLFKFIVKQYIQLFNFCRAKYSIIFLASLLGSFLITIADNFNGQSRSGCSGLDLTKPRARCRLRQMHPWNLWVSVGLSILSTGRASSQLYRSFMQYLQWVGTILFLCALTTSRRHPAIFICPSESLQEQRQPLRLSNARIQTHLNWNAYTWACQNCARSEKWWRTLSRLPSNKFISAWSSQPFFANRLKTSKLPAQATES